MDLKNKKINIKYEQERNNNETAQKGHIEYQ